MKSARSAIPWVAASLFAVAGLFVAGCGGGKSNPMTPPVAADVTITIVGINGPNSFSPSSAVAKVGQTVAWMNSGGTTHTATADGGAFNTGDIGNGSTSAPITMTTSGVFTYHCARHPAMTGTLTVNP